MLASRLHLRGGSKHTREPSDNPALNQKSSVPSPKRARTCDCCGLEECANKNSSTQAARKAKTPDTGSFFSRAVFWVSLFSVVIAMVVASICTMPALQRAVLYMDFVSFPPLVPYKKPTEASALAPLNAFLPVFYPGIPTAQNLYVNTSDGVRLGVWHIAPADHSPESTIERAVLYMHGNAENRGYHASLIRYALAVADGRTHVLTFDYRGFGDSQGRPSEEGTMRDSIAVWRHMTRARAEGGMGVRADRVLVWGHSLGTGVASEFVGNLCREDARLCPAGLILEAPFASVAEVVGSTVWYAGDFGSWIGNRFVDRYDTRNNIRNVGCPLLVLHGKQDKIIPFWHSEEVVKVARERCRKDKSGDGEMGREREREGENMEMGGGDVEKGGVCVTEFVLEEGADHETIMKQEGAGGRVEGFLKKCFGDDVWV